VAIRLTKWRIFAVIVVAVLLLDQLSKAWILSNFDLYESVPLIEPVLYLTRSENTGVAFGIGGGASPIFLLLAIGIMLVVLFFYWRLEDHVYIQHLALSLVIGGGVGNVLDRLQHGVVIDFVHIVIPNVLSNVSNFADHALVIGVIILLIDSVWTERQKSKLPVEEPA
jgi:signal peptidase II